MARVFLGPESWPQSTLDAPGEFVVTGTAKCVDRPAALSRRQAAVLRSTMSLKRGDSGELLRNLRALRLQAKQAPGYNGTISQNISPVSSS